MILTEEKIEMHFDKIIMNPPYDRSLHLKILRQVMNKANEVVNLSPIRWLQDPLAEMKGNRADYGRFADIRNRISSLEAIPADKSPELFGTLQAVDLGIYYLTPEGGLNITPKPFISQGLFDKVNKPTYEGRYKSIGSVCSPEGKPDFTRPFVKLSPLRGHPGKPDFITIITSDKNIAMKEISAGGKKGTRNITVNFNTQEEAENFFNYLHTKFAIACCGNVKMGMDVPLNAIPYLPDYTYSWTDEMLYEYFGLTDSEIQEIEQI